MEAGALDAQSLISLSLRKIHSSRSQRGGIKLHKNLLVSYVLRNARQLYLSQRYAELCRRQQQHQHLQQQQQQQLHYQPQQQQPIEAFPGPDFHPQHLLHIPDDDEEDEEEDEEEDDEEDPPLHPSPPPSPLRSCAMEEELPAPSGMPPLRGEALGPFYAPHRPLLHPPPYNPGDFGPQQQPLPSGGAAPPVCPPCRSRTTVLDLDTHVVTTVDNGYLHQDCACAQCPALGGAGILPFPPPSSSSSSSSSSPLQAKRRYVQEGLEDPAVEVGTSILMGTPPPLPLPLPPFKRKYDPFQEESGPDCRGEMPARTPRPKRPRFEDSDAAEPSNISNLISIFGSGFTGLVGRQQQQHPLPSMQHSSSSTLSPSTAKEPPQPHLYPLHPRPSVAAQHTAAAAAAPQPQEARHLYPSVQHPHPQPSMAAQPVRHPSSPTAATQPQEVEQPRQQRLYPSVQQHPPPTAATQPQEPQRHQQQHLYPSVQQPSMAARQGQRPASPTAAAAQPQEPQPQHPQHHLYPLPSVQQQQHPSSSPTAAELEQQPQQQRPQHLYPPMPQPSPSPMAARRPTSPTAATQRQEPQQQHPQHLYPSPQSPMAAQQGLSSPTAATQPQEPQQPHPQHLYPSMPQPSPSPMAAQQGLSSPTAATQPQEPQYQPQQHLHPVPSMQQQHSQHPSSSTTAAGQPQDPQHQPQHLHPLPSMQQPSQPPMAAQHPSSSSSPSSPPSSPTAALTQPQEPEQQPQQQQQQQQHLNGQLCSKQALASLGAWTRAIVAF